MKATVDDQSKLSLAHQLTNQLFGVRDNQLCIDNYTVGDLVERYGSPLFVYSQSVMVDAMTALREATGNAFDVFYSVKANPNPAVIRVFCETGAGAEVASGAEYEMARQATVKPDRIVFAGPGKSRAELEHVVARGIGEVHVESIEELDHLSSIAQQTHSTVRISLRVNPIALGQGGSMRMGGQPTQFGFDEEHLDEIVNRTTATNGIELIGVHLYAGTQILDASVLVNQWSHAVDIATRIARQLKRPLETVDLGGGLGIPYFANETAIDHVTLKRESSVLIKQICNNPWLKGARVILEPGRYLVGPAGVYLSRVLAVKQSKGALFAITDGGMHHHLAASGNLGQVIKKDYPLLLANRMDSTERHKLTIVGPLCTPLDTYGRKTSMPIPIAGDIVAVMQSGAYGLTASPIGFLSQPMPAELLIKAGEIQVIRKRGTFTNPISLS